MQIPVDTSKVTFLAAGPPEPVVDPDSKQQKTDAKGEPVQALRVVWMDGEGAEVIAVKLAGTMPRGIDQGVMVKLTKLTASYWEMPDARQAGRTRSGISYRAERVDVLGPSSRAASSAAAS